MDADTETLLRRQWDTLRRWLDRVGVAEFVDLPSGLPGWTVRDLVVHLGFGLVMLDEVGPAPEGAEPLSLGEYVAQYRAAAPVIASATQELAEELPDALRGIDALAQRAWAALERGLPDVVLGRRGPLRRDDFVLTRILELVVHGEDLRRAVPVDAGSPLVPACATVVADALRSAYELRAGEPPGASEPVEWIRLATGRTPSADPHLPLL